MPGPLPGEQRAAITRAGGDTADIIVEFGSRREKRAFGRQLDSFLNAYRFDTLRVDTLAQYFRLRLITRPEITARDSMMLEPVEEPAFVEAEITVERDSAFAEPAAPAAGGSLALYTRRELVDDAASRLVTVAPFVARRDTAGRDSGHARYLSAEIVSAKRVRLTLSDSVVNADGRLVSAFDVVEAWAAFVKAHPAEGAALFRHVRGIDAFIRGEEAVIPGVQLRDENTIVLALARDDPRAAVRLDSPRLLPASLKLGPYHFTSEKAGRRLLAPNPHYRGQGGPFLDRLALVLGGDKNPLVSYSLNRYDMLTLTYGEEVDYARRKLLNGSALGTYSTDRYFISLGLPSAGKRRAVAGRLFPAEILRGIPKSDARVIAAIETEAGEPAPAVSPEITEPVQPGNGPLRIVFQRRDPLSVRIAEKVLAHLGQHGLSCRLVPLDPTPYERALYGREYDLAVGWAPKEILDNEQEKLRLASIWFDDILDEPRRIREAREIPLFAITRHLLCKDYVSFWKGRIAGVYRSGENRRPRR
ncbi:MAG: hypothetical protein GF418_01320 [Chitinivibrionales bacterium]|nr:hypothetical protein [Chitinivibrionales bacterium]